LCRTVDVEVHFNFDGLVFSLIIVERRCGHPKGANRALSVSPSPSSHSNQLISNLYGAK
jgi:hypothetical protein